MDVWKCVGIAAVLWAIAGCQTPQAITALERECRMLEDQIYMLEDELRQAESALEACQSRSAGSARTTGATPMSSSATSSTPQSVASPALEGPQVSPRARDANGKPPTDQREFRLPEVDSGRPLPPGVLPDTLAPPFRGSSPSPSPQAVPGQGAPGPTPGMSPRPGKPSAYRGLPRSPRSWAEAQALARRNPPRRLPPPGMAETSQRSREPYVNGPAPGYDGAQQQPPAARRDPKLVAVQAIALDPRADNTRADRITLNRNLTGGYSRDARFGDAGVSVLIEPRDVHGRLVPAAGPVSVVVLDRGRSGDAARVARWDFTAEQISTLYRKTPYGEGFYLEMPWPGSPPDRGHLHLFVRYTTQDGRNLEASCELDVVLPAQRETAWIPLAPGATEPGPKQAVSEWRQKVRAEEPSAEPPAVVATSRPADERAVVAASAEEPAAPAAPKPSAPRRPTWSPLRPDG